MPKLLRRQRSFLFVPALFLLGCADQSEPNLDPEGNTPGFGVIIRADSNRDGKIDLVTQSDEIDKLSISRDRGAFFLPNIDDDANRCSGHANPATCFDASDEIVNGPEDARDLARVKTLPLEVSDHAVATLTFTAAKPMAIRMFHEQSPGNFVVIANGHQFTPQQVRAGLTLAIEGKEPAMDASVWDGRVELEYKVEDEGKRGTNKVALKVAPLLTHTHADAIEHLIAAPNTVDPNIQAFQRDLELAMQGEPFAPKHTYLDVGDEWAQDWVEPMYASIPGPDGPVSIHVLLGSDQERIEAYKMLYTLRGPDVGVTLLGTGDVQALPDKSGSYSSFGNLETIPPHPGYPAGRQILGGSADKRVGPSPKTLAFLETQGVQDPIWLDSSWLEVGHVDEFVSFLPVENSALGFKIVIVDPLMALSILRAAAENGHGDALVNSYEPTTASEKEVASENLVDFKTTIRQFLDDKAKVETQETVAAFIQKNLDILKSHTQVPEQDIIRLPGLFRRLDFSDFPDPGSGDDFPDLGSGDDFPWPEDLQRSALNVQQEIAAIQAQYPHLVKPHRRLLAGLSSTHRLQVLRWLTAPKPLRTNRRRKEPSYVYNAMVPDVANMVVSPAGRLLAAKQFGPLVEGKDLFEEKTQAELAKSGYQAHFIDDFVTYHLAGGEVHCATNTIRKPREMWWTATVSR